METKNYKKKIMEQFREDKRAKVFKHLSIDNIVQNVKYDTKLLGTFMSNNILQSEKELYGIAKELE